MASVSKGRGQSRWSCRRKLRPMRCSLLVFSMSLVLFLLLGVGNSAAAGRHAAGGGGKKTKAGLGATGSDIITITSKNFRETVRFQSDISKSGGGQIPPPVFPLSFCWCLHVGCSRARDTTIRPPHDEVPRFLTPVALIRSRYSGIGKEGGLVQHNLLRNVVNMYVLFPNLNLPRSSNKRASFAARPPREVALRVRLCNCFDCI